MDKMKEKLSEFINSVKARFTPPKLWETLLVLFMLGLMIWLGTKLVKGIVTFVSGNLYATLIIGMIIAAIANYFYNPKGDSKTRTVIPNTQMLEYNYKMFRKHLYKIACEIAIPLNLLVPKLPSNLDAPVRWTFIGETALFHYIILNNNEDVDTDLVKNTFQLRINQKLENGEIDGKEASSVIINGIAYPRIMIHSVENTKNMTEITVVFVTDDYAKSCRNNFANDLDSLLDIRDITDDEAE